MAIRLEVESYCDDCLDFEADVEKPTIYYANFEVVETYGDTVIRCSHRDFCERIKNHLEKTKIIKSLY